MSIRFLRPPTCVPLIFATVIPIPDASIPDSEIVTAAPIFTVFLNVDIPATSKIPVLTLSVAAIPVKFAPLPTNDDAVTIPENSALPSTLILAATPGDAPTSIPFLAVLNQ